MSSIAWRRALVCRRRDAPSSSVGKASRPSSLLLSVRMTLPPSEPKLRSPTNQRSTPSTRLHVRHLVFVLGGRARGEQVRRLGEVGVAVDDLDARELGTQAPRVLGVVDLADHAAGLVAFVAPVATRGARGGGLLVLSHVANVFQRAPEVNTTVDLRIAAARSIGTRLSNAYPLKNLGRFPCRIQQGLRRIRTARSVLG